MQISTRFTIAVHTLLCIEHFDGQLKTTSSFIAGSVNANPVVIRRIVGQLKDAGLIEVAAGVGGAHMARPLREITLLDVFNAVEAVDGPLFDFHNDPNPACPVGRNVHAVLDGKLADAQHALEESLAKTTLAELAANLNEQLTPANGRTERTPSTDAKPASSSAR